jgi:hypothetical protein
VSGVAPVDIKFRLVIRLKEIPGCVFRASSSLVRSISSYDHTFLTTLSWYMCTCVAFSSLSRPGHLLLSRSFQISLQT